MPSFPMPEGRRSKRILSKACASLAVNLNRDQKRLPCLVLDSSKYGFRLRSNFHLRRGQVVEIILDQDPFRAVRCSVIWTGRAGCGRQADVARQTVCSVAVA